MLPQDHYHLADAYSATGSWAAAFVETDTRGRGVRAARLHLPVLFAAASEAARLLDDERSQAACKALRQICSGLKQVRSRAAGRPGSCVWLVVTSGHVGLVSSD